MHRPRLHLCFAKIDIAQAVHLASVTALILMVTVFFAACETAKPEQADSNSMIQKTESGHEVHGEVGAIYGAGLR